MASPHPAAGPLDRIEPLPRHDRLAATRDLLALLSQPGSDRAPLEDRVIQLNVVVAREVARRYRGRGVPADDLEQVACMGLVKAVRNYDAAKATDFLSFAVPTIRGEIRRWFRDTGWAVRPPRSVQELQTGVTAAQEELGQSLGRAPRPDEVAQHLGVAVQGVQDAIAARGCFAPGSLDALPIGVAEGLAMRDRSWREEPGFAMVEARVALRPLLQALSDRDRRILQMRFCLGATQREIGEEVGVTQMQVSRLLTNIFARLRDELTPEAMDGHASVA